MMGELDEEQKLQKIRADYESLVEEALRRERREFVRVRESIPVTLKGQTVEAYLFSLDIGIGGLRILWGEPLAVGTRFELSVGLETIRTWVKVEAEVIWQRPVEGRYEIGLKFNGIPENQREKLTAFVKEVALGLKETGQSAHLESKEKRKFRRIPRLLFVVVESRDKPGEKTSGLVVDISPGGARLITNRQIPPGSPVSLQVEFEEDKLVHLSGRVIWSNHVEALKKFQHGIEFVHAVEFEKYSSEVKEMMEVYLAYQNSLKELNLVQTFLEIMREKV